MRSIHLVLFLGSLAFAGCATTNSAATGSKGLSLVDSGFSTEVNNFLVAQSTAGKKEFFVNTEKEIIYYAVFGDFDNLNPFQPKIFTVEWIDPTGKIFFSDKVSAAWGNNKLVYSKLRIKDSLSSEKLGLWKAKFYRKGALINEESFMLEPPGVRENRLAELKRVQEQGQVAKIQESIDSQKGLVVEVNLPQDITKLVEENDKLVALLIMVDKGGNKISTGSGFLVAPGGILATNYHVIEGAMGGVVKFPGDLIYVIRSVEAVDPEKDLALIKTDCPNEKFVGLGNSDMIQVGEKVVAIGSPLALANSVSDGIVSAVRQRKDASYKLIQITAPIFHGSSGGPLFNISGKVIGITSSGIEVGQNLNFAVPVNYLKNLMNNRNPVSLPFNQGLIKKFEGYRELKHEAK